VVCTGALQQLCSAQLRQSSIPVASPFSGSDHSFELPNLSSARPPPLYRGVAPRPPRRRRRASARRTVLGRGAAGRRCGRARPGSGCRRLPCTDDRGAAEDDDEGAAVCAICLAGLEVGARSLRSCAAAGTRGVHRRVGQQRRRHLPAVPLAGDTHGVARAVRSWCHARAPRGPITVHPCEWKKLLRSV
jgi:hypothetical protein